MKRLATVLSALTLSTVALGGCVSMGTDYDPTAVDQIVPGTPMAEVIARLGQPNNRMTLANGQTQLLWMHSTGTAWGTGEARSVALLFDAQGKFVRVVMTNQTDMR
ncbi:hypothetical protein [Brevundimonas sp.]|uniref:hypothetical protein n=1 Tax=Brevundimonas sp. TaxID=1871086 RepID=UPI001E00A34E|nr:hypothetical protein [Brevundimonas sp.]MBL0947597.1 hypothetical protein [Brevundimonas sp.]